MRTYRIIYEAVEDVRNALEGLLKRRAGDGAGRRRMLQLFKVSKVGTIAGCTGAEWYHPADREGQGRPGRYGCLHRHAVQSQTLQG